MPEYLGMLVAHAECRTCGARYTAWVGEPKGWPHRDRATPFHDLSYRSTFNDEPGIEDLPLWDVDVTTTIRRTPANLPAHLFIDMSDEERLSIQMWRQRRQDAVDNYNQDEVEEIREIAHHIFKRWNQIHNPNLFHAVKKLAKKLKCDFPEDFHG